MYRYRNLWKACIGVFAIAASSAAFAQVPVPVDSLKTDSSGQIPKPPIVHPDSVAAQYDVGNLFNDIFHPRRPVGGPPKRPSGIIVVPNIASNPSIGTQIGIKAVAGRKLGKDPNTWLSVAATSASVTTKGIIYFYISHNIYTPGNKWNFQGSLIAAKTVTPDYGLGIGEAPDKSETGQILNNPGRTPRALDGQYYNFREKVYKEVSKNLFVGAGVSFEVRRNVKERNAGDAPTPYNIYSDKHGFGRGGYSSNGFLFNVQYTTRDNQNRAYRGIYADAGIRVNQTWIGSSQNATQFITDIRKYQSLSARNPEHVIAFWNWGAYQLTGHMPYLELPGTAKDPGSRSGRGYTIGYFKGPDYNYSEVEYRFPILRNKFLSGVTFFNLQTASDESGTKLFQVWQPGGGAGLRVLFNKNTRTNLCLDYAWGKYGARGFFLGLNEAF